MLFRSLREARSKGFSVGKGGSADRRSDEDVHFSAAQDSPARADARAGLYPAGTNAAPARNSLTDEAERHIAASARNNAPGAPLSAAREQRIVPANAHKGLDSGENLRYNTDDI